MKMSFRWYGDYDPIPLKYIRQIPNMHSVVSAVYDVKPGELWPRESIAKIKKQCENNALKFDVVESVPVHENIKLGEDNADELTDIYCRNIERCAEYGVKCITYNFMPVFDWTRTQVDKEAPDGSASLVMYKDQLETLDPLKTDIKLPGWDASYTQDQVRDLIAAYSDLGEEGLWKNLERFLKKIIPTAEKCGVRMAIHPDDPPYSIFGLPRIITNEKNIDRMLAIADSPANSLCLCTGSLGSGPFNDVEKLVRKYSGMDRIAFMHIRQIKLLSDGSFEECGHLSKNGSLNMYKIVKALTDTGFDGYVRPDHGRMIWGEKGRPGYGLYDRALGAAYINGLFEACEKAERD
ncbi:MAG: mannonate dehydratase [Firmicutes bacterium]|nr:mannonate dehydratase [Bacillota bacterium]